MGWDPNATSCDLVPEWKLGPLVLHDPCMVACAGLGILVGGLSAFAVVRNENGWIASRDVQQAYAMTFTTFALMNASGMLNWTVFQSNNRWVLLVDCLFSSCTSVNFALCALTEQGWLHLRTKSGQFERVILVYLLIVYGYYLAFFKGNAFLLNFLYTELTRYASAYYFLVIILKMLFHNKWQGALQLVGSIVIGITGLNMLGDRNVQSFFCQWLNGWLYGMDIWYIQSDISLALLFWSFSEQQKASEREKREKDWNQVDLGAALQPHPVYERINL